VRGAGTDQDEVAVAQGQLVRADQVPAGAGRGWTSTASVEVPAGVRFVDRWDPRLDDVPTPSSRFADA